MIHKRHLIKEDLVKVHMREAALFLQLNFSTSLPWSDAVSPSLEHICCLRVPNCTDEIQHKFFGLRLQAHIDFFCKCLCNVTKTIHLCSCASSYGALDSLGQRVVELPGGTEFEGMPCRFTSELSSSAGLTLLPWAQ